VVTRRSSARCPYCSKETDADAPAPGTDDVAPEPGDVSVCFYCGGIILYVEGGGLRKPTDEERTELLDDPGVVEAVASVLAYRGVEPP
jgi:hypothetical protein